MWAADIGKFTREDIDLAIARIKDLRQANDPNFEWPDLSKVISLMSGDYESEFAKWEHKSAAYKKFDKSTALEILPASEEKARQVFKELWSKL